MEIQLEELSRFVGGQVEIHNDRLGYLYRGEIAGFGLGYGKLVIEFKWFAMGVGYHPLPSHWFKADFPLYTLDLRNLNGSSLGDNRLHLVNVETDEVVVFFPPNGSKLDPSEVAVLELVEAQDWTLDPLTHRSNSSREYERLVNVVAEMIDNDAWNIVHGGIKSLSRLIIANLAHVQGLSPKRNFVSPEVDQ